MVQLMAPKSQKIYMKNNIYSDIKCVGLYHLNVGDTIVVLIDVLYIIQMMRNLIFILTLIGKGFEVCLIPGKIIIGKHKIFKLNEMNNVSSFTYINCALNVDVKV